MSDALPSTLLPRTLSLPDDLHDAIARALATVPPARWVREAQLLSERYRAPRAGQAGPLATGEMQALGYAALILPATYAQLRGALAPSYAPGAVDAQVQAAETYRMCVAANPANAQRCQAVLTAGALPAPSCGAPAQAPPPKPRAAPVDPLSALLGPKN